MRVRTLQTFDEYEQCVELQRIVWEFSDRDLMPARYLKVTHMHGGSVLGAFEGDRLIGFAFAQPSIHNGSLALHSNILAVHPECRNRGIGGLLKRGQRRDALDRGISLITWTYDPLQARNAFLNLNKLGVVVRTYICDLYGAASSSSLHSGLGTDRVLAEWWLDSPRVRCCLGEDPDAGNMPAAACPSLPPAVLQRSNPGSGGGSILRVQGDLQDAALSMEIPADLMQLMAENIPLAREWRTCSRDVLMHYFAQGYQVTRLVREPASAAETTPCSRTYYILEACESRSR